MTTRQLAHLVLVTAAVGLGAWFLYDPPWVDATTVGLREGEVDDAGTPFRWTSGHAVFYVPRDAKTMTLRLNPGDATGPGGGPVVVNVRVDDEPVATIPLSAPTSWQTQLIAIPTTPTRRRTRRVDLRVNRTVSEFNLGVQLGDVTWR
jgi:hypothetical protein